MNGIQDQSLRHLLAASAGRMSISNASAHIAFRLLAGTMASCDTVCRRSTCLGFKDADMMNGSSRVRRSVLQRTAPVTDAIKRRPRMSLNQQEPTT